MSLNKSARKNRRVRALESLEPRQLMHGGALTAELVLPQENAPIVALAHNGEEDHLHFDLGDAPNVYGTLRASNGPYHRIDPAVYLGSRIDDESDGQPTLAADGDDINPGLASDDEDGVRMLTAIVPGSLAEVEITASTDGFVNAWIDWQRDGTFQPIDQIFTAQPVVAGTNLLSFAVPAQAGTVDTFARVRFSRSHSTLAPVGAALDPEIPDGEVEDYSVQVIEVSDSRLDFGDAPDSYGTLLASNGPRHRIDPAIYLGIGGGTHIDGEDDGQPSSKADGDDMMPAVLSDDEDGVRFTTDLVPGQMATVQVSASVNGWLNAWLDFDHDGVFANSEKIFNGRPVFAGVNTLQFMVPANAEVTKEDPTFARFRYSASHQFTNATVSIETPMAALPNGEVEDYRVRIVAAEEQLNPSEPLFDFGTLPEPYPNEFLAIDPRFSIGNSIDAEDDRPAMGSFHGFDYPEYDGISFNFAEFMGTVNVRGAGTLTVKADWNDNGQWESDEIATFDCIPDPSTEPEGCSIPFDGPKLPEHVTDLAAGDVVNTRFVFEGTKKNDGAPAFGEITDIPWLHLVQDDDPEVQKDFGDAPAVYPTLLADNGARHTVTGDLRLGRRIDAEPDGLPSNGAWRDDATNRDDEDGVRFSSAMIAGQKASVDVAVRGDDGKLDAWIDFNQDGVWAANEQIFVSEPVPEGRNSLEFEVPAGAAMNPQVPLYARFRLSTAGGLSPAGPADDGEVEDYAILQGDLNGDGQIDVNDADILQGAIQGDNPELSTLLDLNGDGSLDRKELEYFRENILQSPKGDLDGDGETSFKDFLGFADNFGKQNAKYSDGDLDGDGEVNFKDFLDFAENFGEKRERMAALDAMFASDDFLGETLLTSFA